MEYAQLIIIAILVEAIWENLKMIWQDGKFSVNMLGSLLISVFVCAFAGLDLFAILNINLYLPIVGCIFTGIIVSRGANFVNDLFSKLNKKE